MYLVNQTNALKQLNECVEQNKHSILIDGPYGCGKSYLAKQFANLLHISDFQIIQPKVNDIRECITACESIQTPVVVCVENLELGVKASSYALLKFLEEPKSNVYIVITSRNFKRLPDTIVSRSIQVSVEPVIKSDLALFAEQHNSEAYTIVCRHKLWSCVNNLNTCVDILSLTSNQIEYYATILPKLNSSDTVSGVAWYLQKYPDGTNTPIELVLQYIMCNVANSKVWQIGYRCLQDLDRGVISANAVISKFILEYRYGI